MGCPTDLFIYNGIPEEEFLCTICQDVLKHPTMAEGCEHIFCTSCIQDWITTSSNTCPIDRDPIVGLRPPIRAYMNLYNRLQLMCGFTGCSVLTTLGDIESHISSCQYNPEAIKPCAHDCGASIPMKEISTQNCIQHLKEKLTNMQAENIGLKNELEEQVQSLLTKEQGIVTLERKLRMKEAEIETLRKEVGEKDVLNDQLEKENEKLEKSLSEVTFKFEVDQIFHKELTGQHLSPLFFLRNLPWRIVIEPKLIGRPAKCIGFYLRCNAEAEVRNWSCKANATLRLCSFKHYGAAFERNINHTFCSDKDERGYSAFIDWTNLMDPNKGFVQNDKIRVEVDLRAESPVFN